MKLKIAILEKRYEKLYKNNKIVKEVSNFYKIKSVGIAYHIGGFSMINKQIFDGDNYTPLLPDEEEKDFHAKFFDKHKVYKILIIAYIHNNRNLVESRIKNYIFPFKKIGYLVSMFSAIKNRYFINYCVLQKKHLLIMLPSFFFYFGIFNYTFMFLLLSFILPLLNGKKYFKGSFINMIFFPYKLLSSIIFLLKRHYVVYQIDNKTYEM